MEEPLYLGQLTSSAKVVEASTRLDVDGVATRNLLPSANREIDIERIYLDAHASAARLLGCDQCGTGAEENVENSFAAFGNVAKRVPYHSSRFHGWMTTK
jgi:hypothetical protein